MLHVTTSLGISWARLSFSGSGRLDRFRQGVYAGGNATVLTMFTGLYRGRPEGDGERILGGKMKSFTSLFTIVLATVIVFSQFGRADSFDLMAGGNHERGTLKCKQ